MKRWYNRKPETMQDWLLLFAVAAALLAAVWYLPAIAAALRVLLGLATPFAGGLALAYVLDIPARWFAIHLFGGRRGPGILLAYLALFGIVAALVGLVVPQLVQSVGSFAAALPGYLENAQALLELVQANYGVDTTSLSELLLNSGSSVESFLSGLAPQLAQAAMGAAAVDVTLPGRAQQVGTRHLINGIIDEVSDIFLGLGYKVVEGEEIETDYYNFTALNAPADHPSRSMQDTFYVHDLSGDTSRVRGESDVLLRTQTSGVQVHVMEDWDLPIYMIAPGKVYRRDVADPSHLPQFHQIEGLVLDRGITFGDLKGTLDYVCKQIFGPERKTRFRAHYFPFTEPSAEGDVTCAACKGAGCRC